MSIVAKIRARAQAKWLAGRSTRQLAQMLQARRGLLGLCYHALSPDLDDYPWRTRAEAFDAQLSFLKEISDIVSVEEAVSLLRAGNLSRRDRPVVMLCFDDGYQCNLTLATPVLERHGLPATLFAPRDLIRRNGRTHMSEAGLKDIAAHPLWQVGAHGVTHNVLPGFVSEDQAREMRDCKAWLADLLGQAPAGFAYPQGQISKSVVAHARAHFDYALSTDQQLAPGPDLHQIRRFCPEQSHDDIHCFVRALICAPAEH